MAVSARHTEFDQTVDQSEHAGSLWEQLNELTKHKHLKTGKTMLVFGNE